MTPPGLSLGLGLGLGTKGSGISIPPLITNLILSTDEVQEDITTESLIAVMLPVGGTPPFNFTITSDPDTILATSGFQLLADGSFVGKTTYTFSIMVSDAFYSFTKEFIIDVVEVIDNDSGIGEGDGEVVDDGGFEIPPVPQDISGGLQLSGKSGGIAKFIYDIGAPHPEAGGIYTILYDPDWSQLSQQGRFAFAGFGFKVNNDFHFTGLKGSGSNPAVMKSTKIYAINKFNGKTGFTFEDGGVVSNGTKDGPNWLQIEIAEAGDTYTLRTSADGETWADEFTDDLPVPLEAATDALQFGFAVFLENNDKGVFSVAITSWSAGADGPTVVYAHASDLSGGTHSAVALGDPADDRILAIFATAFRSSELAPRTVTGVTVEGNAATLANAPSTPTAFNQAGFDIAYIDAGAGSALEGVSSASVVVAASGAFMASGIVVWAIYGATNAAPTDAQFDAGDDPSVAIDVDAGGIVLVGAVGRDHTAEMTFSGAAIEDVDDEIIELNNPGRYAAAHEVGLGAETGRAVSVSSASTLEGIVAVSWR